MLEFSDYLEYFPVDYFLVAFGLFVVLFAVVFLLRRLRRQPAPVGAPKAAPARWQRALRLVFFGVFALVFVIFALMLYSSIVDVRTQSLPAPSAVEIPADLPFAVEEVTFLSEDGLKIAGWYVPPENGVTIILLHGYGGNRLGLRWHAERLVEAGYGVLMYDERASGESEGAYRSYGWEDPADVGGALTFLAGRADPGGAQIGIAGCSIGGQIALQGAAYYPQIGAVWADGPSAVRAQDIPPAGNPLLWLIKIANYVMDWVYQFQVGIEAPAPLIDIIGTIAPRPIMLIGGGKPAPLFGSEGEHLGFYASYAGENAQIWVIEEAFHCDGPKRQPVQYAARMIGFFDAAFGVQRGE